MSAPSNAYIHMLWIQKSVEPYSLHQAPPFYYALYAYVHLVRVIWNAFKREIEKENRWWRTKCCSHTTTLSLLHFLAARGSMPCLLCNNFYFPFIFPSAFIICASSLPFLIIVPLVSLKETVLRQVRKK